MERSVDADGAFELMFELLKARPWLREAGTMTPEDAPAETEALAFLLAAQTANGWGDCSLAARRVAGSLIIDFMLKLRQPGSHLSQTVWQVPANRPAWQQALHLVAQQIGKQSPPPGARH